MQALLSFQQAPPLAAPLRFFLTAPVFAIAGGILLVWSGPPALLSRWTPEALAITHLMVLGVMMQVMLGSLFQILPVVAGANIVQPLRVARLVHASLTAGTLLLAAAFLTHDSLTFKGAIGLLAVGTVLFIGSAGHALYGLPPTRPTILGLKLSLLGLAITVSLGALLGLALAGARPLPLRQLTTVHLSWGLIGWSTMLLAVVATVVVPMFQMTPSYPSWFMQRFGWSLLALLAFLGTSELTGSQWLASFFSALLVVVAAIFPLLTLHLQRRSKRARFDATQHYWRVAMLSLLAGAVSCLAGLLLPPLADGQEASLLCGILVIIGGFMSVMYGMLYKIIPFLVWMHLQNLGGGRIIAPNMNKVIPARHVDRQMRVHCAALLLLLGAVVWPQELLRPAAIVFVLANVWLLCNLLVAMNFFRRQRARISALLPQMEHAP